MITNTGKQIVGKYLVGQTDSYASYLAIGSGEKPLGPLDSLGNYSVRTSLTFETLRVPIISKTLITESGSTRVVLTAELPTEERYEITEVGIYPSENNPIPTGLDSQALILFDATESWKVDPDVEIEDDEFEIPLQLGTIADEENNITVSDEIFYTNSNNSLFEKTNYPDRVIRHERPRFLDRTIFVRGDSSSLSEDGSNLSIESGKQIYLTTGPINLQRNSLNDEIRLAFSVVNRNGTEANETEDVPSNVKVLIRFASTKGAGAEYASFAVNLDNGTSTGEWDLEHNRYVVVSKKISELPKTANFSWDTVSTVIVCACVNDNETGAEDFYVALDAIKLENVSSFNNVYGLTAYTIIKTSDSLPIIKSDNTSNLIEFSYLVDVL
jgi:hypothetical protein